MIPSWKVVISVCGVVVMYRTWWQNYLFRHSKEPSHITLCFFLKSTCYCAFQACRWWSFFLALKSLHTLKHCPVILYLFPFSVTSDGGCDGINDFCMDKTLHSKTRSSHASGICGLSPRCLPPFNFSYVNNRKRCVILHCATAASQACGSADVTMGLRWGCLESDSARA